MSNLNAEQYYSSFPTMSHKRNRFPFEKEINFNMKMGEITPICVIRTVPGQTYNLDMSTVLKVAPLQNPPMDNAVLKIFAFHNPDRNTWKNYKYWFGEKQSPEDPSLEPTYLVPKVRMPNAGFAYNSFYDNIGLNPAVGGYEIDAFLPRTDRQIYNTYFRNQSLEDPIPVSDNNGNDSAAQNMTLRKICKPRDFFTQALPTQSGTTPVEIPLGSEAPVVGTGMALGLMGQKGDATKTALSAYVNSSTHALGTNAAGYGRSAGSVSASANDIDTTNRAYIGVTNEASYSGLKALLEQASGAPLEGLYQAIAYNTYQYMTSRGGNRYFEHISNIYGTVNPDGVLQQPEFLGSLSQMIDFDVVTQTSSTNSEPTPLANRAANGYCENYGGIINKSFGEFGWIIIYGVVTYYPKYQQGVSRLMKTNDPLDLFNPLFNLMGDEAIYVDEIYQQSDQVLNSEGNPVNDEVWGYGKRNSRLLYPINEIHGEQRSTYSQSLDTYHFAENFSSRPYLNKTFDKITDEGLKRCLQITDETQFIGNAIITGTNDIEVPLEAIPQISPTLDFQRV